MKTTMLEYSKVILTKVSFCKVLFEKELRKSIQYLQESEKVFLYLWCRKTFKDEHTKIINQVFTQTLPTLQTL